jgi:hypothetical protein
VLRAEDGAFHARPQPTTMLAQVESINTVVDLYGGTG